MVVRRRHATVSRIVKEPSNATLYALTMVRIRLVGEIAVEVDGVGCALPAGSAGSLLGWLGAQPRLAPAGRRGAALLARRARRKRAREPAQRALGTAADARPRDARDDTRPGRPRGRHLGRRARGRTPPRQGRCEDALALGEGTLLADFDDEWVLEARDAHRERTVAALETLAGEAEHAGDIRRAVDLTRRQAALEPLSEAIHRALMRRLEAAGDRERLSPSTASCAAGS